MQDNCNLEILELYEKEISKNAKNKHKVYMFEKNKFQNLSLCYSDFTNWKL